MSGGIDVTRKFGQLYYLRCHSFETSGTLVAQQQLRGTVGMPKALCIAALAISIIVLVFFLSDFVLGITGMRSLAPFRFASWMMDIIFSISAAALGLMSWKTYKEQV